MPYAHNNDLLSKIVRLRSICQVDELVAYGLEGAYAPSLSKNAAVNLEANYPCSLNFHIT